MNRFGEAVREAREAVGISQAELARRMGTGQPTIARLELGSVEPKLSTIARINEALGTELVIRFVPPAGDTSPTANEPIAFTPHVRPRTRPASAAANAGRAGRTNRQSDSPERSTRTGPA
jgi:transcriptional regulator with XRE-family HTH domain